MRKALRDGLIIGLMLTSAMIALWFAGDVLVRLPLPPFDLFAWLTRVLPGPLVTFGIDTMVDTLIVLGFDVAATAKTAEHILAVVIVLDLMTLAAGALYIVHYRRAYATRLMPGIATGLTAGVAAFLLRRSVVFAGETVPFLHFAWLIVTCSAWGLAASWTYYRLAEKAETSEPSDEPLTIEQKSRREFLIRLGGATAAFTAVGAGVSIIGKAGGTVSPPVADAPTPLPSPGSTATPAAVLATIEPAAGTRPEITPVSEHYLIDINPRPPVIQEDEWTLNISGLVDNPQQITLADIKTSYEAVDRYITLSCISNRVGGSLIGTTLWTGASLKDILADAGVQPNATHIEVRSIDGFFESVALDLINSDPRIMLAYYWDSEPLTHEHGFPLRIWIPDRFGMKQPRWITDIEVIEGDRDGYWVVRGWDKDAIVRTTSVIDTVADPYTSESGELMVPIGGIAYAGARGVSRVEVQLNHGDWQEAHLFEPLSDTTWVIWRFDWPFEAGRHRIAVRAHDGDGTRQTDIPADPRPSGAAGIHTMQTNL